MAVLVSKTGISDRKDTYCMVDGFGDIMTAW